MATKFVAFTSLGRRTLPNQWDIIALSLIFGLFVLVVHGSRGMVVPLPPPTPTPIDARLRLSALLRAAHDAAHVRRRWRASLALHADLRDAGGEEPARRDRADPAARRAAVGADPRLPVLHGDVLPRTCSRAACWAPNAPPSSPSSRARPGTWPSRSTSRCAPCRATSTRSRRASGCRPGRSSGSSRRPSPCRRSIWNMMMSMSGGWFFVVASEAITVGDTTIKLPGIGSYLAVAIDQRRIDAVLAAVRHGAGRHPALRPADLPARSSPWRTSSASNCRPRRRRRQSWVLNLLASGPAGCGAPSTPLQRRLRLVHEPAHRPAALGRRRASRRRLVSRGDRRRLVRRWSACSPSTAPGRSSPFVGDDADLGRPAADASG